MEVMLAKTVKDHIMLPLTKKFLTKIFDTISINIRDEAGDLVTFEHGKVIITLHFRCSKTQYFIDSRSVSLKADFLSWQKPLAS